MRHSAGSYTVGFCAPKRKPKTRFMRITISDGFVRKRPNLALFACMACRAGENTPLLYQSGGILSRTGMKGKWF